MPPGTAGTWTHTLYRPSIPCASGAGQDCWPGHNATCHVSSSDAPVLGAAVGLAAASAKAGSHPARRTVTTKPDQATCRGAARVWPTPVYTASAGRGFRARAHLAGVRAEDPYGNWRDQGDDTVELGVCILRTAHDRCRPWRSYVQERRPQPRQNTGESASELRRWCARRVPRAATANFRSDPPVSIAPHGLFFAPSNEPG